jgi:hypothetical protein
MMKNLFAKVGKMWIMNASTTISATFNCPYKNGIAS